MINPALLLLLPMLLLNIQGDDFKTSQLKYPRVRQAYHDKTESMEALLKTAHLKKENISLYLRAFKSEKQLEVWGMNDGDTQYKLIKTYQICRTSGKLGPKRQQGDLQIPEGFYHINRFNPNSNYYLSLGINYPNTSDHILGVKGKLGGDIFIHGACVTIGCLPITDDQIKELYILCIEAKNDGQSKIPVSIFPARLSADKLSQLTKAYPTDQGKIHLWTDLSKAYELFEKNHQLPSVTFLGSGRHQIQL